MAKKVKKTATPKPITADDIEISRMGSIYKSEATHVFGIANEDGEKEEALKRLAASGIKAIQAHQGREIILITADPERPEDTLTIMSSLFTMTYDYEHLIEAIAEGQKVMVPVEGFGILPKISRELTCQKDGVSYTTTVAVDSQVFGRNYRVAKIELNEESGLITAETMWINRAFKTWEHGDGVKASLIELGVGGRHAITITDEDLQEAENGIARSMTCQLFPEASTAYERYVKAEDDGEEIDQKKLNDVFYFLKNKRELLLKAINLLREEERKAVLAQSKKDAESLGSIGDMLALG